jgi:hypothetical protein
MMLIEELRSIAKSVDLHLGSGTSAEGRAADEIEWLQRRVAALERVIRENVDPSHCGAGSDRKLVEEIVRRKASLPALSHAPRPARPADLDGKSGYADATTASAGRRTTVGEPQPKCEPESESSREREPSLTCDPQSAPAIADTELESVDQNLVEMAQQVQAALLRSARPNEPWGPEGAAASARDIEPTRAT